MSKKYQVWECRIYVPASASISAGFDNPPRSAAQRAIESAGIEIIANFSGWAGTPQEREVAFIENRLPVPQADRIEHLERVLVQAQEAMELHGKQYPHMQKGYTVDAIAAIDDALKEKTNG
jgi:hypothetical protein